VKGGELWGSARPVVVVKSNLWGMAVPNFLQKVGPSDVSYVRNGEDLKSLAAVVKPSEVCVAKTSVDEVLHEKHVVVSRGGEKSGVFINVESMIRGKVPHGLCPAPCD
jgi:hypothetical protein